MNKEKDIYVELLKGKNYAGLEEKTREYLLDKPDDFLSLYLHSYAKKEMGESEDYQNFLLNASFEGVDDKDQLTVIKHIINTVGVSKKKEFQNFLLRFAQDLDTSAVVDAVLDDAKEELDRMQEIDPERKEELERVRYLLERKRIREELKQEEYEQKNYEHRKNEEKENSNRIQDRIFLMTSVSNYYDNEIIMAFNYLKRFDNIKMPYHLDYMREYNNSNNFIKNFKINVKAMKKINKKIIKSPKKAGTIIIPKFISSINPIIFSRPFNKVFEVEDGNPRYYSISGSIFSKDRKHLVSYKTNPLDIPLDNLIKDIEYIDDYSFAYSSKLESLVIPDGVKYIGENAFLGCDRLHTIVIPKSVASISRDAFKDCFQLTVLCEAPLKPVGFEDNWVGNKVIVRWNQPKRL